MRTLKALAAIIAAIFCGAVAVTLLAGCQPAKPRVKTLGTTSTTTDAAPKIEVPQSEIKDEKPADEKAADKPADEKTDVLPKGETPSDGNPPGVKPADEKAAKDKPAVDKGNDRAAVLPKGETPTDANPAGVKPADEKAEKDKPKSADSAQLNSTQRNPVV